MNDDRRKQLADFLKNRRSRVIPEQLGLPAGRRRRVPGLRRSEVAELAGVSTDWYTWLEQGRDIHVSEQVLLSLADVFRLNESERKHLFHLADRQSSNRLPTLDFDGSRIVSQFVQMLDPHPAFATNERWDIVAWNQSACVVFGDFEAISLDERNMVWRAFTSQYLKSIMPDWTDYATRRLAQFRASYGRFVEDPWWTQFVERLRKEISDFDTWWNRHDVESSAELRKTLHHPGLGILVYDQLILQVSDHDDIKIFVHIPVGDTAEKMAAYLDSIS